MENYVFDAARERDRLVEALRELSRQQGFSRVVIGISGGKDSSVAAALCARALGKENVYGILLPDGEQKDIADSKRVCAALGILIAVLAGTPVGSTIVAADMLAFAIFSLAGALTGGMH